MRRQWSVELDPVEGLGYEELQDAVIDLTTVLLRCGGVGGIIPHRVEVADNEYQVDRVLIKYDSYAPGLNRSAKADEAEQPSDNGEIEQADVVDIATAKGGEEG